MALSENINEHITTLDMKRLMTIAAVMIAACLFPQILNATKLVEVKSIDKDYILVHFRDGEVRFRDNARKDGAPGLPLRNTQII